MPDYGLRPPPYFSGNLPVGVLGHSPYGWTGTPASNDQNTPYNNYFPAEQFVYERMDWQKFKEQVLGPGGPNVSSTSPAYWSNPPFMGAGQMLGPGGAPSWMQDASGGVNRILRGYLRRQRVNASKPESFVRLYFMYNPDQVQRSYLSWSDSTTLDPTTDMGIEPDSSMSAVPSVTTINFTLFFDRQIEVASIPDHPGVMVDLQAFDVLSGNMVFTSLTNDGTGDTNVTVLPPGMAIPDNTDITDNHAGQYQPSAAVAPSMITAVFSPSLSVQGVLSGASATFTKFSKKMTPTTMALSVTLLVLYAGKNNNQSLSEDVSLGVLPTGTTYNPSAPGFVPPATQIAIDNVTKAGAEEAVTWAQNTIMDGGDSPTAEGHYDQAKRDQGPPCQDANTTTTFTDCSAFVWRAFYAVGWTGTEHGDYLGLGSRCGVGAPGSGEFLSQIRANSGKKWYIFMNSEHPYNKVLPGSNEIGTAVSIIKNLRKGDVLVRRPGYTKDSGHVAFFYGLTSPLNDDNPTKDYKKNVVQILDSGGTSMKDTAGASYRRGGFLRTTTVEDIYTTYSLIARPSPFGMTTLPITGSVN